MNTVSEIALYVAMVAAFVTGTFFVLRRRRQHPFLYVGLTLLFGIVAVVSAVLFAEAFNTTAFDIVRLLCIAVFAGGPVFCVVCYRHARERYKLLSPLFGLSAIALVVVGLDAFLIEPHWLSISRYQFTSSKVSRPLRIAIVSDFQTDSVGQYELNALKDVVEDQPDMVLLAGDYIQSYDPKQLVEQITKFRNLIRDVGLNAPQGIFAVQGNVEGGSSVWHDVLFSGLPITTFPETKSLDIGDNVTVTGLTLDDSFNTNLKIPASQRFHIVLGHGPDFSLGTVNADLLVAGHTHGGQVQLPFYGAVMTLSRIPRHEASGGLFEIHPGTHLLVTRGLGMERGSAPRLRFLCRPEIVFLTVEPAAAVR